MENENSLQAYIEGSLSCPCRPENRSKRRKIFEEGKYLFCGGINEHIIQITKKVQKNHMGCVALAGLESADLAVSPPGQRSPPSRATPVGSLGPP